MSTNTTTPSRFAFFGSSSFSVIILQELFEAGFIPAVIITTPDKPKGRKLQMTPTPVKVWAIQNKTKVYEPAKLNAEFIETLRAENCDLFIIASYGKIIPEAIVNMPKNKTLNVHPSLLPKYRGASPLQSVILDDEKETGITIMVTDVGMDHGPIVVQKNITVNEWPPYQEFEDMMAHKSGQLLVNVLPEWLAHKITPREQDHSIATFTKKISKEDGLIELNLNTNSSSNNIHSLDNNQILNSTTDLNNPHESNNATILNISSNQDRTARANFLKIQAFNVWPGAYFFMEHGGNKIRVKITKASFDIQNNKLIIEKVIPEGSREMSWVDFQRGYEKNH